MTLDQAATLMGLSPRHTRRLLASYREGGVAAVAHDHRGRRAPNATTTHDMVHLAGTRYSGANHTHSEVKPRLQQPPLASAQPGLRRVATNTGKSTLLGHSCARRRRPHQSQGTGLIAGAGLPGTATQFSRAMDELGVQMIFALSPQAKGRVERAAGTFQDRLVTELRLAGARLVEANGVRSSFCRGTTGASGLPCNALSPRTGRWALNCPWNSCASSTAGRWPRTIR